jgi:hypothetical protein
MHYRLWSALAISVAIVAAAAIFGSAWSAGRAKSEVIAVTGLAQQDFVSDLIVWRASYGRQGATVAEAYAQLRSDAQQVQNFLVQRGIPQTEIVISAVAIAPEYREVQLGDRVETVFDGYKLTQNVSVESKRVDKVEQLSREISQLIDAGIILNSQQPQYYYTKLAELKLEHRDLDVAIERMAQTPGADELQLRRLKKRKLRIKDLIARLESELIPDLDA